MKTYIKYILLILLISLFQSVYAQQNNITYSSKGKTLVSVLDDISNLQNIKFAYDSDLFHEIITEFNLENATLEAFLEMLDSSYFVKSKLIEGTWVLVKTEPEILIEPEPEIVREIILPKPVPVSGYIKDKITGENLMYCNVVFGDFQGAMTNDLGFFNFEIPFADSVKIFISHLGYKRLDTLISTRETATILLAPSDIMMSAIEVTHFEKQVLEATSQSEKIGFNPLKAANSPRISSDDLANALLFIPGVNFVQGATSGLSIRGSSPNDNMVLFDGIPVLETSHLLGNMSVLNSKFVQQVFVSRGGFDAEFGERVSGLIELKGKSGKNNKPYLDLSANLLNTNVLANLPITEKFSVTAAWRRSFIDQWQNYLYLRLVDDVSTNNNAIESSIYPTLKYQDLNAKVSFHPSDKIEFNLNLLYGDDYQSRDYNLVQTNEYYRNEFLKSENMGMSFNWNWQINNHWLSSISAGYSRLNKNMEDETGELEEVTEIIENPGKGKGKGKGLVKTKEKTYSRLIFDIDNGTNEIEEYLVNWKVEYNKGIFKNKAGVSWSANSFAYNYLANRSEAAIQIDSIVNSASTYYLSPFFQQYIQAGNQLVFKWGVRSNIDLLTRKIYWQPRGGIEFNPLKELKFHASTGIYYQFLSGVKRIDSEGHFNSVWYLPNESGEGVVRGEHYIFGAKFEKNGWLINAEAYSKNITGKRSLFAEPIYINTSWITMYFPKETNEKSNGIDLFIQKKMGWFNHMASYSVSKTEEQIEDIMQNSWFPGYDDRLHRMKLTEMVSWKNWELTGSWNYASGLPVFNLTDDAVIQDFERTTDFSQLDFTLVKKFYAEHFTFNAGISMLNVLNRKNIVEVDYLRFSSKQGSLTVRSDISALSFTPVVFLNFKFR